jgi:hypothetical protein
LGVFWGGGILFRWGGVGGGGGLGVVWGFWGGGGGGGEFSFFLFSFVMALSCLALF